MTIGRWSLSLLLAGLALSAALAVAGEGTPPAGRARRDYAALLALPDEARERIRRIDREFRRQEPDVQARMLRVMQRYAEWLDRLSPADRQRVAAAPTEKARLAVVREIKERQWLANLPEADRMDYLLAEDKEAKRRQLRERERAREMDWQMLLRSAERQEQVRRDIEQWRLAELWPKLRPQERDRLADAQKTKNRNQYLRLLIQHADQHNVPVPPYVYPPVPWNRLRDFLFVSPALSEAERRQFQARLVDPEQREKAVEELTERFWRVNKLRLLPGVD
jgi:hypothetical protein